MGEIDASNAHIFVFVMCILLHLPTAHRIAFVANRTFIVHFYLILM